MVGRVSIALLLLPLAATCPAHAAKPGQPGYEAPVPLSGDASQPAGVATPHSNWAGYIATGRAFTSIVASWVQPAVTCPIADARASFWVGLGDADTIQQDGTFAACDGRTVKYTGWWEMFDRQGGKGGMPLKVAPGDRIEASVYYAPQAFTLTVTDETSGASFSVLQPCTSVCARNNAEWIVERPGGGRYPLADFTAFGFAGATAGADDGTATISGYPHKTIEGRLNGVVLDSPEPLAAGSSGTAFTVHWAAAGTGTQRAGSK